MRGWETIRPECDAFGVALVTLCPETPEAIRAGRKRHGLQATMLADPSLEVIDRFGFRERGNPSRPSGIEGLPVPTSLLVDAEGRVVWKDQTADFRRRTSPEDVLRAVKDCFG